MCDNRLLVDIKPGSMRMQQIHGGPPGVNRISQTAGRMPVSSEETNVRASRFKPGTTRCCAVQHPDQSERQTRGTTVRSTWMPAVRVEYTPFSCGVVPAGMGV